MTTLPPTLPTLRLATNPSIVGAYAALTADHNPIHTDPAFAANTPFGAPITHGTMAANLVLEAARRAGCLVRALSIRFTRPVTVGDTIRVDATLSAPQGTYDVVVLTDDDTVVLKGTMTLFVSA